MSDIEGGGGGGGGGGMSPPSLSFTDPSSSLRSGNLRLGGIALRNHIEVSLQCESGRYAT
jgi:hypothetical protein